MRCVADRAAVAGALGVGARAASRMGLTVRAGLRLEVREGTLDVTGTDLDLTIATTVEASDTETGVAVVPAKLAIAAIKSLPAGPVTLQMDQTSLVMRAARARFDIATFPSDEWPQVDVAIGDAVLVSAGDFCDGLRQSVYAASTDDARPLLTGVLASTADGILRLVATDSYRMAIRDVAQIKDIGASDDRLIPRRALGELLHSLPNTPEGDMAIRVSDRLMSFGFGDMTITTRLLDGAYPNYQQLIPAQYNGVVTLERQALIEALRRIVVVASEKTAAVRLNIQPTELRVSASAHGVANVSESLSCRYNRATTTVSFNPRYLREALDVMDTDEVSLSFVDDRRPCALSGVGRSEYMALVMPVRIPECTP